MEQDANTFTPQRLYANHLPLMIAPEEGGTWDFTPVINLIYALRANEDDQGGSQRPSVESRRLERKPSGELQGREAQLGDFDELWKYLGQPLDIPPPVIAPTNEVHLKVKVNGSVAEHVSGKTVRWQDTIEASQTRDPAPNSDPAVSTNGTQPTKTQRKKERRRQQSKLEALTTDPPNNLSDPGNEAFETNKKINRRCVIQQILHPQHTGQSVSIQPQFLQPKKILKRNKALQDVTKSTSSPPAGPLVQAVLAPVVRPPPVPVIDNALATAEAKKKSLMSKLHMQFVDERQFLQNISVVQHATSGVDVPSDGIHVFVDISNISIGFHDALKMARGLKISTWIRRQPLSFHNLSLVLERGRPAAKRVLVGSDNFESTQEAKLIGYETNILDRVHKAKELTPRQKKYRTINGSTNALSGQSSSSETGPTHGPEKWVEQAVDEILHLKILESVVDAKEPSTIVLATGDAAAAEYSGGFLKMVERALEKGWKVELMSFRHNTSGAYRKREFRSRWGAAFRTIELDDFVEELLGACSSAVSH